MSDEGSIEVEVDEVQDGASTLWVLRGREVETGDVVSFGADHRMARAIAEALEDGEAPVAEVPSWAVISRRVP